MKYCVRPSLMPAVVCLVAALVVACTGTLPDTAEIPNPSFEIADARRPQQRPADWRPTRLGGRGERGEYGYAEEGRGDGRCVTISSTDGAQLAWSAVATVRPFSRYRLSGWIRTEGLQTTDGEGALLSVPDMEDARSSALTGTSDWTRVSLEFDSGNSDMIQISCLFGGGGRATGQAWYDDLSLELLAKRTPRPEATIQASLTGEPISPYIYGQFIEHLGRCIYGGIWAEMLEDRKFFYAPGGEDSPWRVMGDTTRLVMDTRSPYVGEQTPVLVPAGDASTTGLSQGDLGLRAGMRYEGRIALRGETGSGPVTVALIWGEEPGERDVISIDRIPPDWEKIPLRFTSGASTDEGRLEITGAANGRLRIGTLSLMPVDNVEGFRPDVLALLRELDAPVYRWPGGNFVSGYNWRDGIGDPDRRPPRKNPAWRGIEHNDVGIHEFIRLCELIDTEPYVTVNTGLGSVGMAAEEVAYCNSPAGTPLGDERAANGSPEPFGVKWWAIGNEMYGNWQLGNMPLEEYVLKHNRVVDAMRAVDPDIQVVAVGSVGRWDELMLAECVDHMDLLSEHFYVQERPGVLGHSAWAAEQVRRIADAHRRYRAEIPALEGHDLRIAMDEWNYWYGPHLYGELGTRYFLKDALGIARGFHEYYRNSDIYFMANYAQTVNVIGAIKTTKTEAAFDATGLVLRLYRQTYGDVPVEVTGAPEPLDVAAAWNAAMDTLVVAVVNPTLESLRLPLQIVGARLTGGGQQYLLTGPEPGAYNEPGGRTDITTSEATIRSLPGRLRLPPLSVSIYRVAAEPVDADTASAELTAAASSGIAPTDAGPVPDSPHPNNSR
ncbi:alpha-L-arabinofuranosidase C-terminal domain-containing protein [Gemmatimonadota bacterium]